MDSALKNIETQLSEVIIHPFPIHYDCNDYHVIAFIKDHPEYESIEAMIKEYNDGGAFIRAILTYHDKVQTDYINDSAVVERLKNKRRERRVLFAPIQYQRMEKRGKSHIVLKFTSVKCEEVILDFYAAGKATDKHAGLIDPLGHSGYISLPVMYPERTTLASPKSCVKINEKKYKLLVKIWIPLLFKGMHAYYSELFKIGVFRAGKEQIKIVDAPKSLDVGEKWIYQQGREKAVYEITEVKGNSIVVSGQNVTLDVDITEEMLNFKKISALSQSKDKNDSTFTVEFSPPLPVFPAGENECKNKVSFNISIDGHKELISGTASVKRKNDALYFLLAPSTPDWAMERPVSIVIEKQEDGFLVKTEIVK